MALAFRTNGAPLSGALFVSNPKPRGNRKARRARSRKSTRAAVPRMNRRKGRKSRANRIKMNRGKIARVLANRRRRVKIKFNTSHRAVKMNRKARKARRNPLHIKRNRARRNSSSGGLGFANVITSKAKSLVAKVPVLGGLFSSVVAPLMVGAVVGGVHYVGVKALTAVAPGVVRAIDPVKFTVAGVGVATLLRSKLPGINKIPANLRDQLAVGALLVGGALDAFRALSDKMGDLGEAVSLYDYSDAVPLYDYSGIGMDLGDGGAYDVLPMYGTGSRGVYGAAREGDAVFAPDDLAVDEGEAALGGISAWSATFGAEPRIQSQTAGYYSALAGMPGHRWGWLIKLIGFEKFQQIAALPPEQRQAYIANLKAEALRLADAQAAQPQAPLTPAQGGRPVNTTPTPMAGIGMDLGSPLYAGSAYNAAVL